MNMKELKTIAKMMKMKLIKMKKEHDEIYEDDNNSLKC